MIAAAVGERTACTDFRYGADMRSHPKRCPVLIAFAEMATAQNGISSSMSEPLPPAMAGWRGRDAAGPEAPKSLPSSGE
jgi:hypothetical protein